MTISSGWWVRFYGEDLNAATSAEGQGESSRPRSGTHADPPIPTVRGTNREPRRDTPKG